MGGWGVNGREQYKSGGCVGLDRTVSVGVGLSGQHCTRPLDKCGLLILCTLICVIFKTQVHKYVLHMPF